MGREQIVRPEITHEVLKGNEGESVGKREDRKP